MLPRQRRLRVPIRRRELRDPDRFVRPQLVVRAPDVVVELTQRLAIPVETVEVDIAAASADPREEIDQPAYGVACVGDSWRAAADALFAEGLDAAQPLVSGELGGHVRLVGEFGLVESEDCLGVCFFGFVGEVVDADVVPLHWGELEGAGVGGGVGGPVVEPGDFGAGFGEGEDGIFVVIVDGPAEAAFGG